MASRRATRPPASLRASSNRSSVRCWSPTVSSRRLRRAAMGSDGLGMREIHFELGAHPGERRPQLVRRICDETLLRCGRELHPPEQSADEEPDQHGEDGGNRRDPNEERSPNRTRALGDVVEAAGDKQADRPVRRRDPPREPGGSHRSRAGRRAPCVSPVLNWRRATIARRPARAGDDAMTRPSDAITWLTVSAPRPASRPPAIPSRKPIATSSARCSTVSSIRSTSCCRCAATSANPATTSTTTTASVAARRDAEPDRLQEPS